MKDLAALHSSLPGLESLLQMGRERQRYACPHLLFDMFYTIAFGLHQNGSIAKGNWISLVCFARTTNHKQHLPMVRLFRALRTSRKGVQFAAFGLRSCAKLNCGKRRWGREQCTFCTKNNEVFCEQSCHICHDFRHLRKAN